ncbi:peptidase [Brevibacillus sp. NPDC058079]|uniref:peptidase n=1 Tax=Brevibacillus sp. NPDC058079 TaxID=3346330 RepID=UPI0036E82E95
MKKRNILLIPALSLFLISTPASADTTSDPYNVRVKGIDYSFTSAVWERYGMSGRDDTVEAVVSIDTDENVPIGYMGGQAFLYDDNGTLKTASSMEYNTSKLAGWIGYSPRIITPGRYYAQSRAEFYNGNGYTKVTGYKSPKQELKKSSFAKETETSPIIEELLSLDEYDVNDNGETYGSGLSEKSVGEFPDLISAVGTNGEEGYVRVEDLTPEVTTPKEALEQNHDKGNVQIIPLYAVDGETQIGEFELISNHEAVEDKE